MNNLVTYRRPAAGRLNPVWDNFFSDFFSFDDNRESLSCRKPSADVKETESSYKFEIELPGFSDNEINVSVEKNVLKIKAEKEVLKKTEKPEEKEEVKKLLNERVSGFFRSFILPENSDTEKINAQYDKGVLYLSIEKKEKELPRKIQIN